MHILLSSSEVRFLNSEMNTVPCWRSLPLHTSFNRKILICYLVIYHLCSILQEWIKNISEVYCQDDVALHIITVLCLVSSTEHMMVVVL